MRNSDVLMKISHFLISLMRKGDDQDIFSTINEISKSLKMYLLLFIFLIYYRLDTKMILQRTPEQMIWGYHEPLLEAAALLDDSLTFTSFGFFTKVINWETRSLPRNMRFLLKFLSRQNASKCAIFL